MRALSLTLTLAALLGSCSDPVRDGRLKSLGAERPDVPVGEYHRAGQACVLCHTSDGPASDHPFTVAGTVFAQPGTAVGIGNVTVAFTDAAGSQFQTTTNCVGNFFVTPKQWDPQFPILTRIFRGDRAKTMNGIIGRERSCAFCHHDPVEPPPQYRGTVLDPQFNSAGHIYLYSAAEPPAQPDPMCPVNPNITGGKF